MGLTGPKENNFTDLRYKLSVLSVNRVNVGAPKKGLQMAEAVQKKNDKDQPKSVWDGVDTQIVHSGKEIVLPALPEKMTPEDGVKLLKRYIEMENQRYDVHELVAGAPWDALVALSKALHSIYGVVMAQSIQTFFGEIKPQIITITTGPELQDKIQVVQGQMTLPNIENPVQIALTRQGAVIVGTVRRKDKDALLLVANKAREILRTDSIYKGKAISLRVDDDGELQLTEQPSFLQLKYVQESDMIHTETTQAQIETNIFGPLKFTDACRANRIPLKRGILLEGRYGTGKSLTARVTAKVAIDNGWTFIMLDKAQGLRAAIEFAKNYQPCAIFAEDIDRAADREDEAVNSLVNMLDGVITKDMEMMVVLTTNFINKIDTALLRPGRFDAVISIEVPDAPTTIRLVKAYARELLPDDVNLSKLSTMIAGQIPATVREVVERAKISMLMHSRKQLTENDLNTSAFGMIQHMKLLEPKTGVKTTAEEFYDAWHAMINDAANVDGEAVDALTGVVNNVRRGQSQLANLVKEKVDEAVQAAQGAGGSAESAKAEAKVAKDYSKEAYRTGQQTLETAQTILKKVS